MWLQRAPKRINVGYEVYRIKTAITEGGSKVEAKNWIDKRNKNTRKLKWEQWYFGN